MSNSRNDQSRLFLYLLDNETIRLWRTNETKKQAWVLISEETKQSLFTQPLWPLIPYLLYKNVSLPPGARREICFLLSGEQRRGSEFPCGCFSSNVNSKQSICHFVIFWVTCPEPHQYLSKCKILFLQVFTCSSHLKSTFD